MTRRKWWYFLYGGLFVSLFPKVKAEKVEPYPLGKREITLPWQVRWDRNVWVFKPGDRIVVTSACDSWKASQIMPLGCFLSSSIVPTADIEEHSRPI